VLQNIGIGPKHFLIELYLKSKQLD